ncbi:hypothetical protein ACJX0J_039927 [Zea mays]
MGARARKLDFANYTNCEFIIEEIVLSLGITHMLSTELEYIKKGGALLTKPKLILDKLLCYFWHDYVKIWGLFSHFNSIYFLFLYTTNIIVLVYMLFFLISINHFTSITSCATFLYSEYLVTSQH